MIQNEHKMRVIEPTPPHVAFLSRINMKKLSKKCHKSQDAMPIVKLESIKEVGTWKLKNAKNC